MRRGEPSGRERVGTRAAARRERSESCSLGGGPVGTSVLGVNEGDPEHARRATWAPRSDGLEEGIQVQGCVRALHHGVGLWVTDQCTGTFRGGHPQLSGMANHMQDATRQPMGGVCLRFFPCEFFEIKSLY